MRIAAISDVHLGARQFTARVRGRNAREMDVEAAWRRVIRGVVRASPELVTIAGDVFDKARISNHAIQAWVWGIGTLLAETDADIVVAHGNHDAGKTVSVLTPVDIAEGMDSAEIDRRLWICGEPEHIDLPHSYVVVIPYTQGRTESTHALPVKGGDKPNILVIHAPVDDPALPVFYRQGRVPVDMLAYHFNVVCAGDYHVPVVMRDGGDCLAFYSGAVERVTTNLWTEPGPYGWMLANTSTMQARHIEVRTRPCRDLVCDVTTAADLHADLARLEVADGEMVRLVARGLSRQEKEKIDWRLVREIKRRALHFALDLRLAETQQLQLADRRRDRRTLEEMAKDFMGQAPPEIRDRALRHICPDWADWPTKEE